MKGVGSIVVAAGSSERVGGGLPKQFQTLGTLPMFAVSVAALLPFCDEAVVVAPPDGVERTKELLRSARVAGGFAKVRVVPGGDRRQDSVVNGLGALSPSIEFVLVHDAARPFVTAVVVERVIEALASSDAVVPAVPVPDTVKLVEAEAVVETLDRSRLRLTQTPQGFRRTLLESAYLAIRGRDVTDDAQAVELAGHSVHIVEGDPSNTKVTTPFDMSAARARAAEAMGLGGSYRVGTGSDWHRLVEGRRLVLCGVDVPFDRGLAGHSDADVATHAVCDALLGAAGAGDIGVHFPPGDERYKGISSLELLRDVGALLGESGYEVAGVDVTIVAEAPRLTPFAARMRETVAEVLGVDSGLVSVKSTTTEGLGPEGEGEAMSAHAVAVLRKRPASL